MRVHGRRHDLPQPELQHIEVRGRVAAELGLSDADVAMQEQVADVLAEHPELLQRPVLVKDGRTTIGRPKDRVGSFPGG